MRYASPPLALVLAACGGEQPAANVAAAPAGPSEIQNRITALAPPSRDAMLLRAIRDAGFDCQGVTASEPRREAGDGLLYSATCSDKAVYGVLIGRDGTAQVIGARS